MRYCIRRKFSSAHHIPNYEGACSNLHGHTWIIDCEIEVPKVADWKNGIGLDFKFLKNRIDQILPDHIYLNDLYAMPTAENLAIFLFEEIKNKLPGLKKVTLWESDDCGVIYQEDAD